ncbi:T9SS type A sorting domain-containing protein, partial [Flavobacterium sedimenticola]
VNPICAGATLNALPTTSNNGVTGTWAPTLNNTDTTTYTFTPTAGQCATTTTLTITVNTTPAPTGNNTQNFNVENLSDVTIADLIINPTNVIWYDTLSDALSGNNPLPLDTVLENGQNYFAVNTIDGCLSEPFEIVVSVTLNTISFDNSSITAYPSPTTGIVYLKSRLNILHISVIDTLGQILISKQTNSNENTIDLSSLANSIYYVKVNSENGFKIIRIIKK